MKSTWKKDFLFYQNQNKMLDGEAYQSYVKLISHERYVMKKAYKKETSIESMKYSESFFNQETMFTSMVEQEVLLSEMREILKLCLSKLKEKDRMLINELYFSGSSFSKSQLAKKLGMPRTTMLSKEKRILGIDGK